MSAEANAFIKKYSGDVIKSVRGTGIFPSVKMAQMIIESSGNDEYGNFAIGRGLAARRANNYFGIKADSSWKGQAVALYTPRDGSPVSFFRVYKTPLDSLKDHTKFLLQNPRYKNNGVFNSQTANQQAAALQRAGYAESPTYSSAIMTLITTYNLKSLDMMDAGQYKKYCLIAGGVIITTIMLYNSEQIKKQFHQIL